MSEEYYSIEVFKAGLAAYIRSKLMAIDLNLDIAAVNGKEAYEYVAFEKLIHLPRLVYENRGVDSLCINNVDLGKGLISHVT